jgi:hypothetical protein
MRLLVEVDEVSFSTYVISVKSPWDLEVLTATGSANKQRAQQSKTAHCAEHRRSMC